MLNNISCDLLLLCGNLAEWLRRLIRNQLGFPAGVQISQLSSNHLFLIDDVYIYVMTSRRA